MQQNEKKMILTTEEQEAIICFSDNVKLLPMMYNHIDFLTVHNIPVQKYEKEIDLILEQLYLFEKVMDRVLDRQLRVIMRCRYALGMKTDDIGFFMNISRNTILKYLKDIMPNCTD